MAAAETLKNYVVTTSFVWIVFILSRSAHLYYKVTPHYSDSYVLQCGDFQPRPVY